MLNSDKCREVHPVIDRDIYFKCHACLYILLNEKPEVFIKLNIMYIRMMVKGFILFLYKENKAICLHLQHASCKLSASCDHDQSPDPGKEEQFSV